VYRPFQFQKRSQLVIGTHNETLSVAAMRVSNPDCAACTPVANCGVDLISDVLPFGRLWYGEPNAISNAIGYAMHSSRSHDAVIRVYDDAGNVIETHEHKGELKRKPRRGEASRLNGEIQFCLVGPEAF
jgi:hypothetical protein